MATYPTPTGNNTTAPIGTEQGLTLQQYAQDFDQKFPGKGAGQGFLDYAQAHPSLTNYQDAQAFALEIAFKGVDGAISSAAGELAKILKAAGPGAAAAGSLPGNLPNPLSGLAAIGAFFSKLGTRELWVRIAKVMTGAVLVIVGVIQLSHTDRLVGTVAKAAALA